MHRLNFQSKVGGSDPQAILDSLIDQLRMSSSLETAAEWIVQALSDPLTPFQHASSVKIDALTLPTDPKTFPHDGAFAGALRRGLIDAGVDTPELAWALARRLNFQSRISGSSAQTLLYSLINQLRMSSSVKDAAQWIVQAVSNPLKPFQHASGVKINALTLPTDPKPFRHDGAFARALRRQLISAGVDTPALANALAERLNIQESGDASAEEILHSLIHQLANAPDSTMESTALLIVGALAEPLS